MELLPFVDILKVFNNPINEEQAWAVCFQCAHFLFTNPHQEFYQVVLDSGINSIWLSRHGEVFLRKGPSDPNGSGKGPPQQEDIHHHHSHSSHSTILMSRKRGHVIATEIDAVQALGTAIFEALDYGIEATEERQLSPGLESLIATMTNADYSLDYDPDTAADDEGIEKDAYLEQKCTVADIVKLCSQHLSSKQDAQHHFKAVCRALATEAGELFTFLDKISSGREKLSEAVDEDSRRLEELQRADWACLWVQVMRSLRQGVRLKKIEHVHHPPLEYELTPFEMILEDIRSRRYTLTKITVNGQIPQQVKSDAHAVILDFIRSRPPLKRVHERKLKPKPQPRLDPHELLLGDIRARPKLKPVKDGKLVVRSAASHSSVSSCDSENDDVIEKPVKKVIKPDFNLLLNNSFEESSEEESDISQGSPLSHSSPIQSSMAMTAPSSWQRAVTRENLMNESGRPSRLQRRHTISICEAPVESKVVKELPPLEEEEEPSPVKETHFLIDSQTSQRHMPLTRTCSDNDILAQVTLRHNTGVRRTSLEHRRSLTSLTSGLSAIPEQEDCASSADSAPSPKPNSAHLERCWRNEHAPPANTSPPCKGRPRSALGMGMNSMKTSGIVSHPLSRSHSQKAMVGTSKLSSMSSLSMTSTSTASSSSTSFHSALNSLTPQPLSEHVTLSSSPFTQSSSVSLSSSSNVPSLTKKHVSLDHSVSSQSPVFFQRTRALHNQNSESKSSSTSGMLSEEDRQNIARWRHPKAREERLNRQRQSRELQHAPIVEGEESFDMTLPSSPGQISEEKPRSRRSSLDSGVNRYSGPGSKMTMPINVDSKNRVTRRLSLGVRATVPERSPEEEEKLTRWRSLQEDDLASRRKNQGNDKVPIGCDRISQRYNDNVEIHHNPSEISAESRLLTQQNSNPAQVEMRKGTRQQHALLSRAMSLPRKPTNEPTDVLQQKLASEESRYSRWRRLEQLGFLDEEDGLTSAAGLQAEYKRWQNPVECLSLTLEEVTHIRGVLTKAELESLLSHPDLYQQVSKNKLCFTCKTTRFSLFGEWGTKCKFCKRTVCSKCLRKMNVPSDHFRNIPVYTLSPAPLTPQMQEFIQNFIKTAPACSVPPTRHVSPTRSTVSSRLPSDPESHSSRLSSDSEPRSSASSHISSSNETTRNKSLNRSQSAVVPGAKPLPRATSATLKGPLMAVCCDCKGMVMEIIRASRASLAMLSAHGSTSSLSLPAATNLSNTKQSLF